MPNTSAFRRYIIYLYVNKVKLSQCITKHHTLKTYPVLNQKNTHTHTMKIHWRVEVQLHTFCFTPGKSTQYSSEEVIKYKLLNQRQHKKCFPAFAPASVRSTET
jgi:hypothetical protein